MSSDYRYILRPVTAGLVLPSSLEDESPSQPGVEGESPLASMLSPF